MTRHDVLSRPIRNTSPAADEAAVMHPTVMNNTDLYLHVADLGACTGLARPDDMFPHPSDQAAVERARQVCASCSVRPYCRELARRSGAEHGVWGGRLHTPDGDGRVIDRQEEAG